MSTRIKFAVMVMVWSGTASPVAQKRMERLRDDVVPGAEWQKAMPESLGYSSKKLDVLRQWVSTQDTTSMMVVVQGRVLFSYGDVTHPSKIASARKSILGMLYGKHVQNGEIDLDKTVKQLGLDDKEAFLPIEETATLRQLLAARSGVYLPTSSFGQRGYLLPRGSEAPGAHYLYSNRDFNAAGAAFEKLTRESIYDALQQEFVQPLGMQDYQPSLQGEGTRSTDQMARVRYASFNPGHGASRSPHIG